ncbi:hypothetical protein JI721_05320 [Alicyclobacillus cycloheptanicus]|uniref:Uncharacterized protein n=1 Tax=Alicyclobacillus cycloheptanicus TaxID=1457 RepID=A0ABT9XMP0_9BACL|nr:hypothetical protein [Alicyclobacillus cycloheptanicus]MDQ0191588.1 hypothetical protein [Alicyclobacillus cycloheptanicus]WDM02236.1 hypothetical protein JI721_05320 [Alicyclobacillus cycloheptanicus]
MGFESAVQMGKYMKARGFDWSDEIDNYAPVGTPVEGDEEPAVDVVAEFSSDSPDMMAANVMPGSVLQRYLPILIWMDRHRDQFVALLNTGTESQAQIPRYTVPGQLTTKSVHMASSLAQLVQDFSREKNVRQRDIFEIALLEFFRRHGYAKEVEALLSL